MRIQYIDKLKGLTIILVVIHHVAGGCGFDEAPILTYESFDMPMFMFLSGIFAYKSIKLFSTGEALTFFKNKAFRVLLPFIMVGGIYSTMAFGDPWQVLINAPGAGQYWFLPSLFLDMTWGILAIYTAHLIAPPPIRRRNRLIISALVGFLLLGALFGLYILGLRFPYFPRSLTMFPFFYCGALYGMSDTVKHLFTNNNATYTVSLLVFFALQLTGTQTEMFNLTGIFAIVLLMNLFCRYDTRIPQWLATIGTYSLEIYVFHWFFLPEMKWIAPYLIQPASWALSNTNFAVMLAVSLAVSAVIIALCMGLAVTVRHSRLLSFLMLGGKWKTK